MSDEPLEERGPECYQKTAPWLFPNTRALVGQAKKEAGSFSGFFLVITVPIDLVIMPCRLVAKCVAWMRGKNV